MVSDPGHGYWSCRLIWWCVYSDDVVISLNVEPGAYAPSIARLSSGVPAAGSVSRV